jgi:Flp pilus assembly pilin Flp
MNRYGRKLRKLGQTMTEYIIIVALIAIASIAVVTIFSDQIRSLFAGSARQLSGDADAQPEDVTGGLDDALDDKGMGEW